MARFLRLPEVKQRTGLGRSTIYETPGFPKPVKLGARAVGWLDTELEAWIEARISQREAA